MDGEIDEQAEALKVEEVKYLIKVFHTETSSIVKEGLMEDISPEQIALDYVAQIATYHNELRVSGWDVHPAIQKAGIMVYTPIAQEMTLIIRRKKERILMKQDELMAGVLARRSQSLLFHLDGHSLPARIAVRLVPGVLSDEPERACGKEECIRPPRLSFPSSAQ